MRRSYLLAVLAIAAACSSYNNNTTAPPPNPLVPPANLTYELVPSGDPTQPVGILLRWDPANDTRVAAYNVYSRSSSTATWGLRATTSSPSFYDLGTPDLQYDVTSIDNGYSESVASNVITVDATNVLPAPTGLVSISLNGAIQLSWNPNARNAPPAVFQYYRVYSTSYSAATNLCDAAWALEGTTVSEDFVASGLPNGVSLCFAVSAVSSDGHESQWSGSHLDTPRPDARNILVNAFQVTPASSGFNFFDVATQTLGLVTSGSRTDIDFRIDRHADGTMWLQPIRPGTMVQGLGAVADLTSIDFALTTGYSTTELQAVTGNGYLFQNSLTDGTHYGAVRVTALGTNYVILDWSYQTDPYNVELRRVRP